MSSIGSLQGLSLVTPRFSPGELRVRPSPAPARAFAAEASPSDYSIEPLRAALARLQHVSEVLGNEGVDEESRVITSDKQVNDYVHFVAGLIEENGGDSREFLKRVQELEKFGSSPQSGDVTALSQSAEFTGTESLAVALRADESSFSFSASYEASFSGRFQQEVQLEDGSTAMLDVSFEMKMSVSVQLQAQQVDPLALDMDGDGDISLSDPATGPQFDIDGDGAADSAAFARGADVFLALDKNLNGRIDDGRELFGDQNGAANGFEELSRYDRDGNGVIDARDAVYRDLMGVRLSSESGFEQLSLSQLNVQSIRLAYESVAQLTKSGAVVAQRGTYENTAGQALLAADVLVPKGELEFQA